MTDGDDLMKNAGRLFSKLGDTLKDTAKVASEQIVQTTKQVTGLGRGQVKLSLDQTRAAPGGTIRGTVVLALTEPVDARRLVVTLHARQRVLTVGKGSQTGRSVATSHADVYQFDAELAGEQSYSDGTFAFELTVPDDALDLRPSAGANPLADAVRTFASTLSPTAGPIEWQVVARLDIPWGRDLRSEVDVVVAR